jgi:hypothetical protein
MALFRALLVFLKKLGVNKKDVNQKWHSRKKKGLDGNN